MNRGKCHNIIFRTQCGRETGSGHVMRCLALAQENIKNKGGSVFSIPKGSPLISSRLESEGMEVVFSGFKPGSLEDALHTIELAKSREALWVVADGYDFGSSFQKMVKKSGLNLLVVDDFGHADHYCCDIILNQNPYARQSIYKTKEDYTRLLLGMKYTLIRKEFTNEKKERCFPDLCRTILVTMGGGDHGDKAEKLFAAIEKINGHGHEILFVTGHSDQRPVNPPHGCKILQNANNMAKLMAASDIAISASGSTALEMAYMGLPSITFAVAENQKPVGTSLHQAGASNFLGRLEDISPDSLAAEIALLMKDREKREKMYLKSQKLIDGKGALRVLEIIWEGSVRLRQALEGDSKRIWEWANDPETRKMSFSSDFIPWETHYTWFIDRLKAPDCHFFIAENSNGLPLGQVRLEIKSDYFLVSINIDPRFRAMGYGTRIIALAKGKRPLGHPLKALVKKENKASLKAFEKAGFKHEKFMEFNGCPAILLNLDKESNNAASPHQN